MKKEVYEKLRADLKTVGDQCNLQWLQEDYSANMFDGIADTFNFLFRCEGTQEELYHLRRYLHLNYPLSIIAYEDGNYDSKLSLKFRLTARSTAHDISKVESLNIHELFPLNPQYDNIDEFTVPYKDNSNVQHWDNITIDQANLTGTVITQEMLSSKYTTETNRLYGKRVCITGGLEGMTRSMAKKKIESVGGYMDSAVTSKTDYLVVTDRARGASSQKTKDANAWGTTILSESEFKKHI